MGHARSGYQVLRTFRRWTVTELDDFLRSIVARHVAADTALHGGDPAGRIAMWSTNEPVTLFGAWISGTGSPAATGVFQRLGETFSECKSFDFEVVAAGVSGDLAYTVAYEHITASIYGAPAEPYTLRVTHVYRREDGEWKVVHRHGDPIPSGSIGETTEPG
jgi:ketosteroid isomerase-like protein